MEGERISLRLEGEDLELIDEFIEGHPEYSNRSQLARIALRAFIERDGGARVETLGKDQLMIRVPPTVMAVLQMKLRDGMYNTLEEVANELLRKGMLKPEAAEKADAEYLEKARQLAVNL